MPNSFNPSRNAARASFGTGLSTAEKSLSRLCSRASRERGQDYRQRRMQHAGHFGTAFSHCARRMPVS